MATPVGDNLDLQSAAKVINSPDPSAAQDVATKNYADQLAANANCLAWMSTGP